jgi:TolA-binding protein
MHGGQPITPPMYEYAAYHTLLTGDEVTRDLVQESQRRLYALLRLHSSASSNDHVLLLLAAGQIRSGNREAGFKTLDSLVQTYPTSSLIPAALLMQAEQLFIQKQYAKAAETYSRALLRAQREVSMRSSAVKAEYTSLAASALFWEGISLILAGKSAQAEPRLLLCAAQYPSERYADDALLFVGRLYDAQAKVDEAAEQYQRLLANYPRRNTRLAAYIRLAQNELLRRLPNDALLTLGNAQELVALSTDRLTAEPLVIARHDAALAQPSSARSAMLFHPTLRQSPDTETKTPRTIDSTAFEPQQYAERAEEHILYLRGEANNLSARYEAALQLFTQLLAAYPQSLLALRARLGAAFALLHLERYDTALQHYDAVINADNEALASAEDARAVALARLYRPLALKRSGNGELARRELNALALRSDFPYAAQALVELGQLQYEDGKVDEARKTLERAAREAQDVMTQVRAQLLLGETALDAGFYNVALRAFERARTLAEQSSTRTLPNRGVYLTEIALKHGIALVGAKQYSEAMLALNKFLAQYTEADGRDEAAFWLAEAQYNADLMKNAETSYQAFLKQYPDSKRSEEAWYGLGWTQFRTRQFTESASTFARMLREFPQSRYTLDALTRKGDGHYLSKQYRPAVEAYRQAARLKPKSEQGEYAAFQTGQCLYRLQEFDQAVVEMERFIKTYPTSTLADDASYLIGWIHFQQRRYEDAVVQFKLLAEQYPDASATARGYYAMGDALYNLGKFEAALDAYKAVADRYPTSPLAPDAVNAMQYCLTVLGREQEAAALADAYIMANPNSALGQEVKFKKAEILFNGRKFTSAIAEYEDFLRQYPSHGRAPEAMFLLAQSYAAASDSTRAVQMLRRVQQIYPKSPFAARSALELGLLRMKDRRFDEADTFFVQTIRQYPDDESSVRAAFERANLREQRGDTLAAIQLYAAVAERYKGSDYGDRCRFRVASWFRSRNQNDSARAQFAQLVGRTDELGAEAQYRIGELYQREKQFQKAIEAYAACKTNFADIEDWYSLSLLNMAYCHEQLKNTDAARELYKLVLLVRKNDDFARAAQQSLERLSKM